MLTSCQSALTRTLQVHMCELGGEVRSGRGRGKSEEEEAASNCCYVTKAKYVPPLVSSFLTPPPPSHFLPPSFLLPSTSFLLPPYPYHCITSSPLCPHLPINITAIPPPSLLLLPLTSVQSCVVVRTCAVSALYPSPEGGRGVAQ